MQNNYGSQYNQQQYNQQQYSQQSYSQDNRLITPWGYIGYSLLFAIPIVGLIMVLVFSFSKEYPCRRNYARAMLIGFIIALVIALIMYAALGKTVFDFSRNGYGFYY